MIEREFIAQKTKEFYIRKYIENKLKKVGISQVKLKKIPLGEKIIIYTGKPSLIVGSRGSNIKDLTKALKHDFKLENPQVEINEVKDIFLDATIVAEKIASSLERFGSAHFKGVGHKMMSNVLNSGALGVEIILSGKIPGARAKNWRFYRGYLKKCGDISFTGVRKAQATALLKSGIIGIKVAIMPPGLQLPDHIEILETPLQGVGAIDGESSPSNEKTEQKEEKPKSRKKSISKSSVKKETKRAPRKRAAKPKSGEPKSGENTAPTAPTAQAEQSTAPRQTSAGGEPSLPPATQAGTLEEEGAQPSVPSAAEETQSHRGKEVEGSTKEARTETRTEHHL